MRYKTKERNFRSLSRRVSSKAISYVRASIHAATPHSQNWNYQEKSQVQKDITVKLFDKKKIIP